MFNRKSVFVISIIFSYVLGYFTSYGAALFSPPETEECFCNNINDTTLKISVEVGGAVANPGVYDLEEGSRTLDAIKAAGDFSSDYDYLWVSKNINLSQILKDEQKIFIPFAALGYGSVLDSSSMKIFSFISNSSDSKVKESSGSSGSVVPDDADSSETGSKVNVNTASFDELDSLPGIGAVYAGKIIENRPYSDLQDFEEKSQVTSSIFEKIKDLICF